MTPLTTSDLLRECLCLGRPLPLLLVTATGPPLVLTACEQALYEGRPALYLCGEAMAEDVVGQEASAVVPDARPRPE